MSSPKYAVGERVWYIWTDASWTTESCRVVAVRSETEIQEGDEVLVHHYRLTFDAPGEIEEGEYNLYPTKEAAQALCDKWNSYPTEQE